MGFLDIIRAPQPPEPYYDQQVRKAGELADTERLVQVGVSVTQRCIGEMARAGTHEILGTYNTVAADAANQSNLTEVEGRALVNQMLEDSQAGTVAAQRIGIEADLASLTRYTREVAR